MSLESDKYEVLEKIGMEFPFSFPFPMPIPMGSVLVVNKNK